MRLNACSKCGGVELDHEYHGDASPWPFVLFHCLGCAHQWKERDYGDYEADDE